MGALAVIAMLVPGAAARALPWSAADYPTWDEVQQARANTAATAALVASIGTLLDGLQAESARLNGLAIEQGAAAAQAESERDAAAAVADQLDSQADAAAERAEFSAARAAQVVAAVVRSGGPDVTLALLTDQDENLLQRLAMLERVGGQFDAIIQIAQFDRNTAGALAAQAEDARATLAALAATARTAADAATQAAADADARVAEQQAHLDELYAQLASLQGTSAEQERLYRIGQQVTNEPGAGGSGGGGGTGEAVAAAAPTSARSATRSTIPRRRRRTRGSGSRTTAGTLATSGA